MERARKLWPIAVSVSEPKIDADGVAARWSIEASGPNWSVTTAYELLRWDDIVARDMTRPMWIRLPRSIHCFFEYLSNGTIARIFLANWRFGLFYLYPTACVVLAVVVPALIGGVVTSLAEERAGLAPPAAALAGIAVAVACYLVARRLAQRAFALQLADCWLWVETGRTVGGRISSAASTCSRAGSSRVRGRPTSTRSWSSATAEVEPARSR